MDAAKRKGKTDSRKRRTNEKTRVRIVIADDDAVILNQIALLLETRFDVVGRVANGRELVKAVDRLSPSVVVTDVAMPKMNGIQATVQITTAHPLVKVVIVSVHTDEAIVEAAFAAGASAYVNKFRVYKELIQAIEDVLTGLQYRSSGL